MIPLTRPKLLIAAGCLWLFTSLYLLQYGARLLISSIPAPEPFVPYTHPLLETLAPIAGGRDHVAVLIVLGCLTTGLLKCRYVLSRSVRRGIDRIMSLPNPSPITKIYPLRYYLLILSMVALGFFLRHSGTPEDLRAACYLSIGFGMMKGSSLFFKHSLVVRESLKQ